MKIKILTSTTAFLLSGLLTAGADSGSVQEKPVRSSKSIQMENRREMERPLFGDDETSVDVFGAYANPIDKGRFKDGFGGGVGANHFFTKYVGLGLDAYAWNGDRPRDGATGAASGSIILRYPIESMHLAPYIFGGVGGIFTESVSPQWTQHAGLGAEYRFTPNWGIFADARYVFVDRDNDYMLPRAGVRYTF